MAIESQVGFARQGTPGISKWRSRNPDVQLDLSGETFKNISFVGADLSNANLRNCTFENCTFDEANLSDADMSYSKLGGSSFTRSRMHRINLTKVDAEKARFGQSKLENARLVDGDFTGCDFSDSLLDNVDASHAIFAQAGFGNAKLNHVQFTDCNFNSAHLFQSDFRDVNIAGASFIETDIQNCRLERVSGAPNAKHLETVRIEKDARYFETCQQDWIDRHVTWESLGAFGRFPLFGISYTTLIVLYLYLQFVAFSNNKILAVNEASSAARAYVEASEHVPESIKQRIVNGKELPAIRPDPIVWLILVSNGLLAVASTIYAFWCPQRVKEFSCTRWCDELGKSLLHYWPLAWKHRQLRIICGACYILGASGVGLVILWKFVLAAILLYQTVPLF